MPVLILIGVAAMAIVVVFGRKEIASRARPDFQCLRSSEAELPLPLARNIVRKFLCKIGYELKDEGDNGIDIFIGGDESITRLPTARRVRWPEVPRFVGAGFEPAGGGVKVSLLIRPLPTLTIAAPVDKFFLDRAGEECAAIFDMLRAAADEVRRANASAREARSAASRPALAQSTPSDLDTLGLRPGASWDEVQTAYRDACKKYHPDRLAGQNLAPHLTDLAVRRFTEVSAAYNRLRRSRQTAA